jgi:hypothetical protein
MINLAPPQHNRGPDNSGLICSWQWLAIERVDHKETAMNSPRSQHSTEPARVTPILSMAEIILSSRRPLADMRGIMLALDGAGFNIGDVRRYVGEAIVRARLMKELA